MLQDAMGAEWERMTFGSCPTGVAPADRPLPTGWGGQSLGAHEVRGPAHGHFRPTSQFAYMSAISLWEQLLRTPQQSPRSPQWTRLTTTTFATNADPLTRLESFLRSHSSTRDWKI